MTPEDLIKVTDQLPEKGTECLVYSTQGGFSIARFTDLNSTYGCHYKEAWFTKSGRQMSKKTITHWMPLPKAPKPSPHDPLQYTSHFRPLQELHTYLQPPIQQYQVLRPAER